MENKTVKEILKEIKTDSTPLYNSEALKEIQKFNNSLSSQKTILGSNIPRELLYTPLSNPEFNYTKDLGNSGQEPFTRGIHSNMYRGKEFTRRQLTGYGTSEDTNERIKFMLDHGATGVSILFDIPTIQMYDSDDPFSLGQVGLSGVCIDSINDMENLFKGINLEETTVSIVTHYPSNTAILFSMFLAYAEENGISWEKLKGSVQNDITLEELVRSGATFIKPKDCFRIQCDNIEFLRKNVPLWYVITLNGYNLREFGTTSITESAIAIANGIATIDNLNQRGLDVDSVAPRISFFWSSGNDFFEEIARFRAVRRLWYKIIKYKFHAKNPRSMWMRCHTQTSGGSLVQQEPMNNIVRSAYQALAAVLGGTQSLHVDSYDEAYSIPTQESALLSLRTQQILQEEIGITNVVDPLGGSFYIETLTNIIENKILDEIDEIERNGGYISMIESGQLHKRISEYFCDQQKSIDSGEIPIIACNKYESDNELPPISTFNYSKEVEIRQHEKLAKLRKERDNDKIRISLNNLKEACKSNKNIFQYCIDCSKARCTENEMFKVFQEAFGLWNPPTFW
jgi:methylmalonyl-CoA mutase N-terminal domain/subunit